MDINIHLRTRLQGEEIRRLSPSRRRWGWTNLSRLRLGWIVGDEPNKLPMGSFGTAFAAGHGFRLGIQQDVRSH